MLDSNRVEEIVAEVCEHYIRKRNGNGFNARCPVCGDSQKNHRLRRLHIDWYQKYEDWVVTCYNGGCSFRSGNIYSLYATVTGSDYRDAKKYINQDIYNTDEIKKRMSRRLKTPPPTLEPEEQVLDLNLAECLPFNSGTTDRVKRRYVLALREFMRERHIRKPCYVAFEGRYKNRFIIPVVINGEMVYFQGRAMSKATDPKYFNPVVDKTTIIMNRDKFDRSKSIVLTEGIIDAWMVEHNQGTSVLGAYFDDDFIEQVLTMTDKDVILCFDNPLIDEAGREVMATFLEESRFKDKVMYFLPNRKDFKDLNELRCLEDLNIYDYILSNSFSSLNTKVKLSLLYK